MADYILKGITKGFRLSYSYNSLRKSATRNMPSANAHQEVISEYLTEEMNAGRILGPFQTTDELQPPVHISRFGVIPKKDPGKWRLIVDLSYPERQSINDGISPQLCSLKYITIAARTIWKYGRRAELAKIDIESAYRIIPVYPPDRHLLGMSWQGAIYIDTALPFGLHSAPKIFNAVADCIAMDPKTPWLL